MKQLNREQELAASHLNGPMLVLAGPGSGKTAVLTERICRLIGRHGVSPEKILVLTFSKEAAKEMQERFSKQIGSSVYPVHFGTFHAVFYHILRKQGLYNENSILNQKTKREYIRYAGRRSGVPEYADCAWQEEILSKISAKKSGRMPEFPDAQAEELFEKIFLEYSDKCRQEKKLDFDDMITECIKLLTEIPKVLAKWQEKYDYILVDEFQDIDLKQYEVLKLLAGEKKNVFAVGDDDQSIYGFRGACPSIMKTFKEDYGNVAVVNLVKNYRSGSVIIENAVNVIRKNAGRLDKRQEAAGSARGEVCLKIFKTSIEEAGFVIEKIRALQAENPAISTGILYRTGRCPDILENELKKLAIRYQKTEKSRNYYEEEWVKDLLSYLRLAERTGSGRELLRILDKPERGLSREAFASGGSFDMAALRAYYRDDADRLEIVNKLTNDLGFLGSLPVKAALNFVLKGIGYERELKKKYDAQTFEEVVAELFERTEGFEGIREFLDFVDRENEAFDEREERRTQVKRDTRGEIVLQTAHASKGLEYDVVFIIGLQEGSFPHKKAQSRAEIEEERRLFYVAMTRAREKLYILGRRKDDFGKTESRFVHELICKES